MLVSIQAMIFVQHPVLEEPGVLATGSAGVVREDPMVAGLRVRCTCMALALSAHMLSSSKSFFILYSFSLG